MDVKMSDDKLQMPALYDLSVQVVYEIYIQNDVLFDIKSLPDPITCDIIRQVSSVLRSSFKLI